VFVGLLGRSAPTDGRQVDASSTARVTKGVNSSNISSNLVVAW
jgi:hypothetical protein